MGNSRSTYSKIQAVDPQEHDLGLKTDLLDYRLTVNADRIQLVVHSIDKHFCEWIRDHPCKHDGIRVLCGKRVSLEADAVSLSYDQKAPNCDSRLCDSRSAASEKASKYKESIDATLKVYQRVLSKTTHDPFKYELTVHYDTVHLTVLQQTGDFTRWLVANPQKSATMDVKSKHSVQITDKCIYVLGDQQQKDTYSKRYDTAEEAKNMRTVIAEALDHTLAQYAQSGIQRCERDYKTFADTLTVAERRQLLDETYEWLATLQKEWLPEEQLPPTDTLYPEVHPSAPSQ